MNITKQIKVDLINPGSTPIIHAVQNDSYSRSLEIELFCSGAPFHIPGNARVLIRYRKSDGSGGEYDTLPDGTCAWQAERNLLCLSLAPSMLTTPGSVSMTVSLITDGQQLSIFPLRLTVDAVAAAPTAKSENYFYVTGFLPAPDQAKKGQYLRVSEVSACGRVTAMEAVTGLPGSGGTVDETTVHEIVDAYLEENPPCAEELDNIRTELNDMSSSKVGVSDIVDNLTTNASGKPLSAAQGVAVKGLIDDLRTGLSGYQPKGDYALRSEIPGTLPNPNVLTINGTSYDGSEAVEIAVPRAYTVIIKDNGDGTGTSSGSFETLKNLSELGYTLIGRIDKDGNSGIIQNVMVVEQDFASVSGMSPDGTYWAALIAADGVMTGNVPLIPTTLPNPNALTINGISYDGATALDVTEAISALIDAKLGGIENGTY